jgi:hypothetical protein
MRLLRLLVSGCRLACPVTEIWRRISPSEATSFSLTGVRFGSGSCFACNDLARFLGRSRHQDGSSPDSPDCLSRCVLHASLNKSGSSGIRSSALDAFAPDPHRATEQARRRSGPSVPVR